MCNSHRHVHYPILSIVPILDHEITGFDIEFELADGSIAKAELRSNLPSWQRILSTIPGQKSKIRIDTFNHNNLKVRTQDFEIAEVHIPL